MEVRHEPHASVALSRPRSRGAPARRCPDGWHHRTGRATHPRGSGRIRDDVQRTKVGRRNRYTINPTVEMRHDAQRGLEIGSLLDLLLHPPNEHAEMDGARYGVTTPGSTAIEPA